MNTAVVKALPSLEEISVLIDRRDMMRVNLNEVRQFINSSHGIRAKLDILSDKNDPRGCDEVANEPSSPRFARN